jgi:hypothetical protein
MKPFDSIAIKMKIALGRKMEIYFKFAIFVFNVRLKLN